MVGGVSFLSASSRASSPGWRLCAAVHGSSDCFSRPRIAGTERSAADTANKTATDEAQKTDGRRLASGGTEFLGETPPRLNEWICGFKEIAPYFLSSARVR